MNEIRITQELFLSPEFQALNFGTRALYIFMMAESDEDGVCFFDIDASNDYDLSYNIAKRNKKILKDAGFISYISPSEYMLCHQGKGRAVKTPKEFLLSDFGELTSQTQLIYFALWMESKGDIARFDRPTVTKYGFSYATVLKHVESLRQAKLLRCHDINEYRLLPIEGMEVIAS